MAKQSGLGDQLYIGGFDLGADIASIGNLSTPRETLPSTGITQFANARIFGKRDGMAEFSAYFNPSAGQAHSQLKLLPYTDTILTYLRGAGLGNEAFSMNSKQIDYAPTRGDDGSLMCNISLNANSFGADWGNQLTSGVRTDTVATNGTGVDFTTAANPTSAAFGFQAYLHVTAFTGTSATIAIQESSDNGVGDAFTAVSGGAFTAVTAPTAQRIQSVSDTLSVERYLRVVTTGTFSNIQFVVVATRNDGLRVL